MQRCSKGRATFEGNPQSFRIVTRLALRSVDIFGLNLTRRTLNAILKYPHLRAETPPDRAKKWGAYDSDSTTFHWARQGLTDGAQTLEAALMDWADDVTYAVHDVDDFYRAGLVPLDRLTTDPLEMVEFKRFLLDKFPEDGDRLGGIAEALLQTGDLSSLRRPFVGRLEERIELQPSDQISYPGMSRQLSCTTTVMGSCCASLRRSLTKSKS